MKKKRKLVLSRETIHEAGEKRIRHVAGGWTQVCISISGYTCICVRTDPPPYGNC